MLEAAMLCWDRPNANTFNTVEQIGEAGAAQVYFHLMQGKRLIESDVESLVFSGEEISGGVWPDYVDLTAGLCLYSPKLVETLTSFCDSPDDVYQFFEPNWMSKPDSSPNYKICNLLDLRRDAFVGDRVMLTPEDPEVLQGRVSIVKKAEVEGAKHLMRLKAGRVIAVQPLLGTLMDQRPVGLWFRNRVRWSD